MIPKKCLGSGLHNLANDYKWTAHKKNINLYEHGVFHYLNLTFDILMIPISQIWFYL